MSMTVLWPIRRIVNMLLLHISNIVLGSSFLFTANGSIIQACFGLFGIIIGSVSLYYNNVYK